MRLNLPSGAIVEVEDVADFPALIQAAERRIEQAQADARELKRLAKQMKAWPVAEKEGAK